MPFDLISGKKSKKMKDPQNTVKRPAQHKTMANISQKCPSTARIVSNPATGVLSAGTHQSIKPNSVHQTAVSSGSFSSHLANKTIPVPRMASHASLMMTPV